MTIPKGFQKNSKSIPKAFQKHSKAFQKDSKRIPKGFQKNSQDFENITHVNFLIPYIALRGRKPFRSG
jgi:hypothetical protein